MNDVDLLIVVYALTGTCAAAHRGEWFAAVMLFTVIAATLVRIRREGRQ